MTSQETVFASGMKAEVYIEGGSVEQENPTTFPAGLTGVLAAGNFDSPIDVLHVLFLRNNV